MRILRARPVHILGLAALVFGATATLQALIETKVLDAGYPDGLEAVAQASTSLLSAFGLVFYAGLLDLVVGAYHRGEPDPTVRQVVHQLPHGRLVVADTILVVGCGTLALLYYVPGITALTFFCLIGPLIVTEDHRVIDAFRRSFRLTRPHFFMVLFMVVVPLIIEDRLLHGLDVNIVAGRYLDDFIAYAILGAAVGSIVGLLEVVLAHEFRLRDPLPEASSQP